MTTRETIKIAPQPGPQTQFMQTSADIAIFGGAAGGGKTYSLLMDPLRYINNPDFGAVFFRRTTPQIRNEGGLWDESVKIYRQFGATPVEHTLLWRFPSGASISFAHLEHEKTVHNFQGSQICAIFMDELCHYTSKQFWYMLSRNRSTCGVRPYVRATCNPDADSWVAGFISWWIDQDTGYPIPERSGKLRWFVRVGDNLHWADRKRDLAHLRDPVTGEPIPPKSLTFIPALLTDNKILMQSDPNYIASLMALPPVERERLLGGNWKIRWSGIDFLPESAWLVDNRPVPYYAKCDYVFAVIDSATKTGNTNDATAVVYFGRSRFAGHPLMILDWDTVQIEGSLLIDWLPSVLNRLEDLARACQARQGSAGVFIEDKASGEILNQQAARLRLKARPIESRLTSLGKNERAMNASPAHWQGKIKISEHAYDKVVTLKGVTRNHFISQVTSFRLDDKDAHKRADDLLDAYTYGVAIALGETTGF